VLRGASGRDKLVAVAGIAAAVARKKLEQA
jgi:hypothetical protein